MQDLKKVACLSGAVIAWTSIFYEAYVIHEIFSIICLHIDENNSKLSSATLDCAS